MTEPTCSIPARYPAEVRERAAIYELDGGLSKDAAEARAMREWDERGQG